MIEKFSSARILVIGDVMLDRYWTGDVERISPEAPVPVVRVMSSDDRLGGAANVARNIASLGARSVLFGVVGDDEAGRQVQELVSQSNIDDCLTVAPDFKTTVKLRIIARQQQMVRADFELAPSDDALVDMTRRFEGALRGIDIAVLSDYAKGSLHDARQLIDVANRNNVSTLIDPKGDDYQKYKGAFMLTPNRSEFVRVVGLWKSEPEMAEKAHALRSALGVRHLLVTRSEEGMSLFTDRNGQPDQIHFPTLAREVFDVSGAGDTVMGVLAAMLGSGHDLIESVRMANRAGGIVVGKRGTATVTAEELFLAE